MSEVKLLKLGDDLKCSLLSGFAFKSKDYVNEGIPIIKIGNIQDKRVSANISVNHFPKDLVNGKIANYYLKNGDVLIAMTGQGSVGRVGKLILPSIEKALLNQRVGKFICDEINLNIDYLFYVLTTDLYQNHLFNTGTGSGQPNLSPEVILETEIPAPTYREQHAIASVLSSLDDKIGLLHRQNKTLEAMAETLFRQWFVEEVDEGWEEGSLLELIQLVGGGTPKTVIAEYWNGDIPWLAGGDIATNHKSFVNYAEKRITETGLKNSSAKLLPKYATVISARGTVGKYCLLAEPMSFSQSNYGILPNIKDCFFFTYLLINHVVEELQSSAYGSVFDTITTTTFKENKVPMPTETEIVSFEKSIYLYFQKMFINKDQIRTLEKLRDTLLPKLMSGEVRVEV